MAKPGKKVLEEVAARWLEKLRGDEYPTPDALMNALSGPQDVMGMDPNVNRLSLLPRYSAQEGVVAPQWLYDLARAAQAPGNALMGHNTTPEEAFNFAGNVQLGGFGASAAMRDPAPGPGRTIPLTTYHGSPHRINNVTPDAPYGRFDMSKIGTGEGAQAYGHGVYLAEQRGTASSYKRAGTDGAAFTLENVPDGPKATWAGPDPKGWQDYQDFNSAVAKAKSLGIDGAIQFYKDQLASPLFAKYADEYKGPLAALERMKASGAKSTPAGHLYTVDLPDEHIAKMLDWDAPLSQQPEGLRNLLHQNPNVTDALKQSSQYKFKEMELIALNDSKLAPLWRRDEIFGPNLIDASHRVAWGKGTPADMRLVNRSFREYAGVYDAKDFLTGLENTKGLSVGDALEKAGIARPETGVPLSQQIHGLGYPGIKYFDGGSRAAGEGTRNFVIFDPEIAKILKRE